MAKIQSLSKTEDGEFFVHGYLGLQRWSEGQECLIPVTSEMEVPLDVFRSLIDQAAVELGNGTHHGMQIIDPAPGMVATVELIGCVERSITSLLG